MERPDRAGRLPFFKLRRGQESNLSRLLRTDNGFEDREGHQAPFTLRRNCGFRIANCEPKRKIEWLLKLLDRANDGVEVRPVAGIEFGMEQFAIGANFKSAAARRNERKRFDAFAEFKNFGRQTDGLRRVVSDDAIFDRDFGLHSERSFPRKRYGVALSRSSVLNREVDRTPRARC
jgi:hypothetical protein